ncbi:hypothetical protein [Pseudoalteromonas xiamenensis]|uniref:Uncharacterized protein n=1 Tax=Pseudoalteromonas xiamenensis TaxID=882626 RepID=A0A975DFL1_9GAMM|nr:hypothetical protein [Pseudoalteromonas xiamenensis]QTH70936.1 hypothetical protein J5O05_13790 [Pseudoalteromonas xiamenensis]
MGTAISSLSGGGVKRVLRGSYYGSSNSGAYITIPEVNPEKAFVNMPVSISYGATDNDSSDAIGGWATSIWCELIDSKTIFVRNLVEMYTGGKSPIQQRYVNVVWEVIEYV